MQYVKNRNNKKNTLANVRRTATNNGTGNHVFPQQNTVPAGEYSATIDSMEPSVTNSGGAAYDTCYTLKDKNGKFHRIRQRNAADSVYLDKLIDQLLAAGVDEDADFEDLKGLEVDITLSYGSSGCASINIHPVDASSLCGQVDEAEDDFVFDDYDEDDE